MKLSSMGQIARIVVQNRLAVVEGGQTAGSSRTTAHWAGDRASARDNDRGLRRFVCAGSERRERNSQGRRGSGGRAPDKQSGILWVRVLLTAIRPPRRDAPGRHGERWSALRGGPRRVFRDSRRRMRPAPWRAMVETIAVYPVVALGVRCTPGAYRPQGCVPILVVVQRLECGQR